MKTRLLILFAITPVMMSFSAAADRNQVLHLQNTAISDAIKSLEKQPQYKTMEDPLKAVEKYHLSLSRKIGLLSESIKRLEAVVKPNDNLSALYRNAIATCEKSMNDATCDQASTNVVVETARFLLTKWKSAEARPKGVATPIKAGTGRTPPPSPKPK